MKHDMAPVPLLLQWHNTLCSSDCLDTVQALEVPKYPRVTDEKSPGVCIGTSI